MLSFYNNHDLKAAHVANAERHAKLDMLAAGRYQNTNHADRFKGCSIGCFAQDYGIKNVYHERLAFILGLPEWLLRWQDAAFENLPESMRKDFHVNLAKAIPVGVDLTPVRHSTSAARMDRMLELLKNADYPEVVEVVEVVERVRDLHLAETPADSGDWAVAESAAQSAADSTVRSAADSAAWAAWAAARSAADSAWSAADSAAWAADSAASWAAAARYATAWAVADSAAWETDVQVMIKTLENAKC